MNLDDFHFLLTSRGQRLLDEVAATPLTEQNHLEVAARLRGEVGPDHTHAILQTILLRQRAAGKFSRAGRMYFTRPALEQASSEGVANYRAGRFAERGYRWVADLGCGVGGDAIALTAHSAVIGVDLDLLRLAMARENVRAYDHAGFHPVQADLHELPPLPVDAFFFDPARRDERGRRIYSVEAYEPPLSLIDHWRERVPHGAVKISPGVDYAEIPPDAEIEFISLDGEVKEGVLWYGDLNSGADRRATLLPEGHSLVDTPSGAPIPLTAPQAYLYEPDGAVIRAHLVEPLAAQLGAVKIDADIAYLTAPALVATPFARAYEIEDHFPFQLKRLRAYLRQRGVGQATIKKRGSPLDPDDLRRRLRLSGDAHRVVFLTHIQGQPSVIISEVAS